MISPSTSDWMVLDFSPKVSHYVFCEANLNCIVCILYLIVSSSGPTYPGLIQSKEEKSFLEFHSFIL